MTTIAIILIALITYIVSLWSDASRINLELTVPGPELMLVHPIQDAGWPERRPRPVIEVERETWVCKATRAHHNPRRGKVWPRWSDESHLLTVRRKKELSRNRAEGRAFKEALR